MCQISSFKKILKSWHIQRHIHTNIHPGLVLIRPRVKAFFDSMKTKYGEQFSHDLSFKVFLNKNFSTDEAHIIIFGHFNPEQILQDKSFSAAQGEGKLCRNASNQRFFSSGSLEEKESTHAAAEDYFSQSARALNENHVESTIFKSEKPEEKKEYVASNDAEESNKTEDHHAQNRK